MQENNLKTRIMRRIYGIWFVKRAAPLIAGSLASLFIALKVFADRFFVAQIVKNFDTLAKSNVWALPKFIESAVTHAEPSVLLLISMALLISLALAIKLLRSIRSIMANNAYSPSASYINR